MGHFGYKLPKGIVGEVASTSINIIRTFIAKEDIEFGEPVQIDHTEPPGSRIIHRYTGVNTLVEPLIGVTVYNPDTAEGYYKAGDTVSVLTFGDIRVRVQEEQQDIYVGDQVFVNLRNGPTDPKRSPFEFSPVLNIKPETYGSFVDGGVADVGNSFVIHFDSYKTKAEF